MSNWISKSLTIPESAPWEIREACTRWELGDTGQTELRSRDISLDLLTDGQSSEDISDDVRSHNRLHAHEKPLAGILENVFGNRSLEKIVSPLETNSKQSEQTNQHQEPEDKERPTKRQRTEDISLDAALARLLPAKEPYHVKVRYGAQSNEWKSANPPTQRYHPNMRQPVDRPTRWNDYGVRAQAKGKVPHESVLDYLVDVMRNKNWRGTITEVVSGIPTQSLDPWPRTHFSHISRMIAANPFLLRLAQIMEGRFFESVSRDLDCVPAVVIQGETNRNAPLEPRYIAAILVQALGRENADPCSLCAGDWNTPSSDLELAHGLDTDVRPFKNCVSLYSLALPPRFAACGNHFWLASIADCACVNLTAPIHPDERYEYIFDTFSPNAANYMYLKTLLKDEFLQVIPAVPAGYIAFGPFLVRNDIVRSPSLLKYGADLLVALAQFQYDRGQEVDDQVPETGLGKELRDKLARM